MQHNWPALQTEKTTIAMVEKATNAADATGAHRTMPPLTAKTQENIVTLMADAIMHHQLATEGRRVTYLKPYLQTGWGGLTRFVPSK